MKQATFFLMFSLMLAANSFSQIQERELSLDNLQVPNSPAFVLLDASPTSVEKPASTKAFAASIMNALNENNGIPMNYAVEFTPFWFSKHPELTAFKFWGINAESKSQLPFSSVGQYSISFALVTNKPSDSLTSPTTTNVSLGIRTTIVKVWSDNDKQALLTANEHLLSRLRNLSDSLANIGGQIIVFTGDLSRLPSDSANAKERIQGQIDSLQQERKKLLDSYESDEELLRHERSIQDILVRRPLFAMEGAIASNVAFENNDFSSNRLGRIGGWLNLAYAISLNADTAQSKKDYLNAVVTARYLSDHNQRNNANGLMTQNLFDSGGKLELEIERVSVSYEYLYRWNSADKTKNSFRSSGMLKFKIKDDLYLTAAFGRNFGDHNNLISQFGINWGIGTGNEKVQSK